jgi:hypothetical protein
MQTNHPILTHSNIYVSLTDTKPFIYYNEINGNNNDPPAGSWNTE